MISLSHYLTLSAILFTISVAGIFLNRKNVIVLLMCVELMLLAVNFNFIAFSRYLDDPAGQVFVFLYSPWQPLRPPLVWLFWLCCFAPAAVLMFKTLMC